MFQLSEGNRECIPCVSLLAYHLEGIYVPFINSSIKIVFFLSICSCMSMNNFTFSDSQKIFGKEVHSYHD